MKSGLSSHQFSWNISAGSWITVSARNLPEDWLEKYLQLTISKAAPTAAAPKWYPQTVANGVLLLLNILVLAVVARLFIVNRLKLNSPSNFPPKPTLPSNVAEIFNAMRILGEKGGSDQELLTALIASSEKIDTAHHEAFPFDFDVLSTETQVLKGNVPRYLLSSTGGNND